MTMDESRRTVLWTIGIAALGVAGVYAAFLARHVLLLIYISGLFAIGFNPVVRFIERRQRRSPRWLAILVLYVVILGALSIIIALILPPLIDQAKAFWAAAPGMFSRAQEYLIEKGLLRQHLTLREAVAQAPGSGDAVSTITGAALGIVGGLFGLFTILILTFYLLLEADSLHAAFLRLFPRERRAQAAAASGEATRKISAWLNGQLLLAGTIGTTAALGLWILGVPYFYVLALIAAVGEMVPVVGPLLAAVPAIGVALTISYQKAILVAIFFLLQQQFENHVLVPKIMSRQVGVSAVTVITALLIGAELLGVLGAILAVPTAAILQVIYQETLARD
ncbi:MAG TPA: AI-2E family transporter [Vicinamibacterales bacterium]|nr:AI-2E family transporter [Vicinamibacterales bacterium]